MKVFSVFNVVTHKGNKKLGSNICIRLFKIIGGNEKADDGV